MRFIIDASSDIRLVPYLQALGHDATFVGTDYPGELSDIEIAAIAHEDRRIVVTDDRHFGDLAIRRIVDVPGIVYFRIPGQEIKTRIACFDAVFDRFPDLIGLLVVATPDRIRTRRLAP